MREFLLVLILAGAGLHASATEEEKEKEKNADVKYKGPVVYTNLPPPVLYFPNFPERPKFSNRGSDGDAEDKRIEYVPFPYKDLPLLVYQSQSQPPIHVVEKKPNSMTDDSSQLTSGYQTGPAVYRVTDNEQYGNEDSDSAYNPQTVIATPSEKYVNVGLSTSSVPSSDAQNQQYISIGLTSIQSQGNDLHGQSGSVLQGSNVQQTNNLYNQMQYSGNQNIESSDYSSDNAQPLSQTGPGYVYYTNQYPNQNTESQAQVPVEHLTQAIQNYLLQQAQSGLQQTLASYSGSQDSLVQSAESPTQHVGITIIRQPPISDSSEQGGNEPQYSPPPSPPVQNIHQPQIQNNQGYENNQQQFVSIGVYPVNVQGNDYGQDPQQYYNVIAPVSNDQYQDTNEDYGQSNQNYESPPSSQNENTQTSGYQVISIDLSALKQQNSGQQRNPTSEYSQPIQRPPPPPPPPVQPPQNYRPTSENDNSYGTREKEFQQIVIQIPNNILAEQPDKGQRGRGTYDTPYTGTAQVANVIRDSNKIPNRPAGYSGPNYNRPIQQKPPPAMHQSERPRNPKESFGFPQNDIISKGINIAIIKQTDSSNKSPMYKNFDQRPPPVHPPIRAPTQPVPNRIPPPPRVSPHRPMVGYPNRPVSATNTRYNYGRDVPNFGGYHYPASETRYQSQRHFAQYKNRPPIPQLGRHPGIYSSSNHHYTTVNPSGMRSPYFPVHQSMSSAHASASKTQAQFVPSPVIQSMPSSDASTESVEHVLTNNIGEINFDEINAFLSPSYDLFGSLTNGPDKKKVEEETKFLQKVTGDLLTHDFNPANLVPPTPSYGVLKPPPYILNAPFPYKFWEQPMIPPVNMPPPGNDRIKMMNYYSHMQYPYAAGNRPFNPLNKGKGRKLGLGKGRLRKKLASLRTSIRHKSKIAPRHEESDDGSETTSEQFIYEIAAPRSTIIKRDGPGLDGITIPLRPEHMLLSRVSMEDEEEDQVPLPPIIVYKGSQPPVEIYGSKSDIEGVSNDNETKIHADDEKEPSKNLSSDQAKDLSTQESFQFYSSEGGGYIDYMYSMLPELLRASFHRRLDSDKWLPLSSMERAMAEDTYDRNKTVAQNPFTPSKLSTVKEPTVAQNSSLNVQPSVEETVEELFSLLGKEEISDLVKE